MDFNRNANITVGTDSLTVSDEVNKNVQERVEISIQNTSTGGQNISLSVGDEAVAGSGKVMSPGGFWDRIKDATLNVTQDRLCVISSAAGGTIAIQERRVSK